MRKFSPILATLALLAATPLALAAGRVDVKFVDPDRFADVGRGSFDIERNTQTLAEHFRSLAPRLRDGQTLQVEVLDVDLAGELRPSRSGQDIRVLRGAADWPQLKLRYTLSADGKALATGEDSLADMNYLFGWQGSRQDGPLSHELRMIDRWFTERLAASTAAAR